MEEECPLCKGKGKIAEAEFPKCSNPTCNQKADVKLVLISFCSTCNEQRLQIQKMVSEQMKGRRG